MTNPERWRFSVNPLGPPRCPGWKPEARPVCRQPTPPACRLAPKVPGVNLQLTGATVTLAFTPVPLTYDYSPLCAFLVFLNIPESAGFLGGHLNFLLIGWKRVTWLEPAHNFVLCIQTTVFVFGFWDVAADNVFVYCNSMFFLCMWWCWYSNRNLYRALQPSRSSEYV